MKFGKLSVVSIAIMSGLSTGSIVTASASFPHFSQSALAQSAESASESKNLLVNLTTDDTWTANMAISLAQTALQNEGQAVTLFLNVRGVYLADRERLPATEGNSAMNIHEKLQAFMASGGQVIICPSCAREAGLVQDDLIEGVVLGEAGGILPFLLSPDTTTISY